MADTKITALTAITTVDPAVDVLPIVDVSDTTMAASGTTKKITSNQILGAGGTATLASATITGDLTVDTSTLKVDSVNNRVGIGTASPLNALHVLGSTTGNVGRIVGGATGQPLFLYSDASGSGVNNGSSGSYGTGLYFSNASNFLAFYTDSGGGGTEKARIDSSGNVGVGVTPSAWQSSVKAVQLGGAALSSFSTYVGFLTSNAYNDGAWKFVSAQGASRYEINANVHSWHVSTNSPSIGGAITFIQAMTLDASGRLFVGATAITAGYTGNNYFVVGGVTSPTIKLQSTTGPAAWDIYSAGGVDLFVAYNASDKGQFNSSTGVYTALSDANKKKDFEPSNIGLAEVLKLKPTLFRMIGAADDSSKELGFVAQDVQSVIPQAYVETESQGGKFIGLQDRPIIAALTRAIQELTARVEALEA